MCQTIGEEKDLLLRRLLPPPMCERKNEREGGREKE